MRILLWCQACDEPLQFKDKMDFKFDPNTGILDLNLSGSVSCSNGNHFKNWTFDIIDGLDEEYEDQM